jgi:hypothetical protein
MPPMTSLIVECGLGVWAKSRHFFNTYTTAGSNSLF